MTKEELALEVVDRLKKEYPDVGCTLDYDQAWKLLVSVRLAAQCTDARVNVVVQDLYEKYPDVSALADADVEDIERIVRPCGLGKSKARDISACMKILRDAYGGRVPDGLVDGIKEPKKVEMALWKLIPPKEGSDFCHRLVFHGRDVCTARTKPRCGKCCLQDICPQNGV